MSIVNKLKPPMSMWIEDDQGNIVADETKIMKNEVPPSMQRQIGEPPTNRFAHFRHTSVQHAIFGDKTEKNPSGKVGVIESTIGACGKSIAKLILEHSWRLNDACILFSVLCEGCMNTVCSELEGYEYSENPNTCCDHCNTIRPNVPRPLTVNEEKNKISGMIAKAGLKIYAEVLSTVKINNVYKRMIIRNETTGHYRVIEKLVSTGNLVQALPQDINFEGKKYKFVKGKVVIKQNRKTTAKIFYKPIFYKLNNIKRGYNIKLPYTLEFTKIGMSKECTNGKEVEDMLKKYLSLSDNVYFVRPN